MKNIFRSGIITFLICLSILFLFNSRPSAAFDSQVRPVRVGYPLINAMTMKDSNGNLSGYTYDYLMEISQYTGWNYEFVFFEGSPDEQIMQSMEMLKNGQIDLLGSMYYDASLTSDYAYPGYCYGINYAGLYVPEHSILRESALYNLRELKVGVHSKTLSRNPRLDQFAQMNGLNIEQIITSSSRDYYSMLKDGRAEAILSTDVAIAAHGGNMYSIAHFSPTPFYFAASKGNTALVQQLDYALSTIDQVNPNFMAELYNEYFSPSGSSIVLSDGEKNYIKTCDTLEVVMYDNKPPFQFIDPDTGSPCGITVEVLDHIGTAMGLNFHYNTVSTYQEYLAFIESGQADIAADMLSNYQDAKDTNSSLTLPWYSLPLSKIFKDGASFSETDRIAVPYFLKNVIPPSENITYYDTVEECMNAVLTGFADFCYAGEFCSQYYLNNPAYYSLNRINQASIPNQKLCFGICDPNNLYLHTILNKGITSLPENLVNEITYRNTYRPQEPTLAMLLMANRNLLISIALAIAAAVLLIFYYLQRKQQKRIEFENKRYDAISSLANEYFYEYNVLEDMLSLSDKCAAYFDCEQIISGFSRKLSALEEDKRIGIWQLGSHLLHDAEGSLELSCRMPDNTTQWFSILSSVVYDPQKRARAVGKITNIQSLKEEQLRLEQQAAIDGLTGIYNILTIKNLVQQQLEQYDAHTSCALIILDIDSFKLVNDTFGHYAGDSVLVETANLLSGIFEGSLVGRLGGDEFIVFATGIGRAEIETRCSLICKTMPQKIQAVLATPFYCSIGIAWTEDESTYDVLYKHADAALYQVKTLTKNGYAFYCS